MEVVSDTQGKILVPAGDSGPLNTTTLLGTELIPGASLYRLIPDHPTMAIDQSLVCSGQSYYNSQGDLLEGTRSCIASDSAEIDAVTIRAGTIIAGVEGSLDLHEAKPSNLLSGVSIAGVEGNIDLSVLTPDNIIAGVSVAGVEGALDISGLEPQRFPATC